MDDKQLSNSRKKKRYGFLFRFLIRTVVFILVVILLLTFVFRLFRMTGNTMSPFVRDGDFCVFYRLENIYTNDVVLYEDENGTLHVGRIVASGGQTVDFPEVGGYEVDGYQPTEEVPYETYGAEKGKVSYPLELKEDEYFLLNDFRKMTSDSRQYGAIKREQIKGKLLFMMRRRNF